MEIPKRSVVLCRYLQKKDSMGLITGNSLDQEQEQQDVSEPETQPESNHQTLGPRTSLPLQVLIEMRIEQLHSRRVFLQKMQQFMKKAKHNSDKTTDETAAEDSDALCELEAIQKELEELLIKKEELEKSGKSSKLSDAAGLQEVCPTFLKAETPHGGIYMLPPTRLTPQQSTQTRPAAETPADSAVPVDSLDQVPAITKCPSCQEVVFTETHRTVSESMWMLCCLCSMMGCVAGCCLLPFFVKRLKNVDHKCPVCQSRIHTHQPWV